MARINQDQDISPQLTLWNQQGSEVIQGTLLVIPIEEALLYIRPLYLRAEGGRIPELKQVIVAYQNEIVMEATLDGALSRLFGPGAGAPPTRTLPAGTLVANARLPTRPTADPPTGPLVSQAADHYRRALEAQRDGDWAGYGAEIEQLGMVLEQMGSGPVLE